jgi:ParB-like chromosome segregation protein Spo0J
MEYHELANLLPLDEKTIDELAGDIKRNGQLIPIDLFEGKILDGRRRWLACQRAGVEPKTREADLRGCDPVAYVLALNLTRRHLTPSQKAMVAARARKWHDAEAKKRQKEGGRAGGKAGRKGQPRSDADGDAEADKVPENFPEPCGDARDQAGQMTGVSGRSVDHATKVIEMGTPTLAAAVDAGHMAVSAAARATSRPAAEQDTLGDRAAQKAKGKPRRRPTRKKEKPRTSGSGSNGRYRRVTAVGLDRAAEAISCLKIIPVNDPHRERGLLLVASWVQTTLAGGERL